MVLYPAEERITKGSAQQKAGACRRCVDWSRHVFVVLVLAGAMAAAGLANAAVIEPDLQMIPDGRTRVGAYEIRDADNWHKFTLKGQQNLTLALGQFEGADLDLCLYKGAPVQMDTGQGNDRQSCFAESISQDSSLIAKSVRGGYTKTTTEQKRGGDVSDTTMMGYYPESVSGIKLEPGEYYIRVHRHSGNILDDTLVRCQAVECERDDVLEVVEYVLDYTLAAPVVEAETASLEVREGETGSYEVRLTRNPEVEATVEVTGEGTDLLVQSTLTFSPDAGDWEEWKDVTVEARHDVDALQDRTIRLCHTLRLESGTEVRSTGCVDVTIQKKALAEVVPEWQPPGQPFVVDEGGMNTYTVRLEPLPGEATTVEVEVPAGTDLTVSPTSLTFSGTTPEERTLTVTAREDADTMDDGPVILRHSINGRQSAVVEVTIRDNDRLGVTVNPRSKLIVHEGGSEDFTVVLNTQPTGNVEVEINPAPTGTDVTVDRMSLMFTPGDWNVARLVTVNAAHDDDTLADPPVNLSFVVTGADYDGFQVDDLEITIVEDDVPGVVVDAPPVGVSVQEGGQAQYQVWLDQAPHDEVTVVLAWPRGSDLLISPEKLTFGPNNWDQANAQPVTVTAREDNDAAADDPVTIQHSADGMASAQVTVTILEDDMMGVTVNRREVPVEEGGSEEFTVVLDTEPTGDVVVTMTADLAGTDLTVRPMSLTFTPGDWNVARLVTVNAAHDDDTLADPPVNLSFVVTGADYDGFQVDDLEITIVEDDVPGVVVDAPPVGVSVQEGGQAQYQVWLDQAPHDEVTVVLAWPRGSDLLISPEKLTFGPNNWDQANAQPVTVTAREDNDAAADDPVTIQHSADGMASAQVTVTILEDDMMGVTVNRREVPVEEGGSEEFTVVLDTEPTGDVVVTMTADLAGTDLTVRPMSLTFTPGDWNAARTVTVAAAEDEDVAQDPMVTLVYTVTGSDPQYNGIQVDPVEVEIREVDHVIPAEYRLVKRSLKRAVAGAVANVTKNIGSRFSGAGGGQTTLTLAGQRVPIGGASAASAGAGNVWKPHLFTETKDGLEGQARSLSSAGLFRSTEFQVALGATELQPIDFSNWTLWGRGDIALFDSEGSDDGQYDTDLKAGYLGVDKWLNQRWLGGVATSRIRVDSEYGLNSGGGGRLKFTMTSVHPYLRYSPDASNEWWVILGAGTGEIENKRDVLLEPESSRALLYMGATGARRVLTTWADQAANLALVGDLGFGYLDGQSESDDQAIGNLALETLRVRLGLSGSYTFELAERQTATSFIEVAGRFDGGEGDSDFGLEFSGGVVFAHIPSGLAVELRGNILGLYTDRFYREYGASATASMTSQAGGEGLSLAVTPRIGRQNQGADILWRDAPFALPEGSLDLSAMSLDARVGYGFSAPALMGGPRVLLTPFGEMRLKNEDERRLRAGVRFGGTGSAAGGSHVELFVDQDDGVDDVQHRVGLVGRWRF